MKKQNMDKIFQGFFGETLAKADSAIAKSKETKKESTTTKINYKEVYDNFFGGIMKRTEKF